MKIFSSVLICIVLQWRPSSAQETQIISPVVSYQFQENPADLTSGGSVSSQIASYQYFDWAGDDFVNTQKSPEVSYFHPFIFGGQEVILRGKVTDDSGEGVFDASVYVSAGDTPQLIAKTTFGGTFESIPISPGIYKVSVSKPLWVADERILSLSETVSAQNFTIKPYPELKELKLTSITPPKQEKGIGQLLVWDGKEFQPDLTLIDKQKMTVVLTHGWIVCLLDGGVSDWPKRLAIALSEKGLPFGKVNILAWDWQMGATACLPPEHKTPREGVALGKKLQEILGTSYAKPLDFLGHSLGAIVNRYAVNYLHGHQSGKYDGAVDPWDYNFSHVVIFDGAEIARIASPINFKGAIYQLQNLLQEGLESYSWKSPIPVKSVWIDNYISEVSRPYGEAVNVVLQKADPLRNHVGAHSYPQQWYIESVKRGDPSNLGFPKSFMYQELYSGVPAAFVESVKGWDAGSFYYQSPNKEDMLSLSAMPQSEQQYAYYPALSRRAQATVDLFDYVVDKTIEGGVKFGNATLEVTEFAAVKSYEGLMFVGSQVENGGAIIVDTINRASIRINLQTGPGVPLVRRSIVAEGSFTNSPAFVLLPLYIPSDAKAMVFDFAVTGDGKDDSLVFAVNDEALFDLETRFISPGVNATSSIFDVASYAGKTNEVFFGIVGGTSTDCAITISAIRFYSLREPVLAVSVGSDSITLSWPSTAHGFYVERNDNLESGAWSPIHSETELDNSFFRLRLPVEHRARFFRLRR